MASNLLLRHAVVLNNIGVSLLEKRCHIQALVTLRDAVELIKMNVVDGEPSTQLALLTVAARMQSDAIQRLANPVVPKFHSVDMKSITYSHGHYWSTSFNLRLLVDCSSQFHAIRIEDIDCLDLKRPMIESSIFLYNMGLAHLAMSTISASNREDNARVGTMLRYRQAALKNLHLSQRLCETCLYPGNDRPSDKREVYIILALIISSRTTMSLQQTEVDAFQCKLSKIKAIIMGMDEKSEIYPVSPRHAAGA